MSKSIHCPVKYHKDRWKRVSFVRYTAVMATALALCLWLTAGQAFAHKVIVFAWVENGQIFVEGGFGGKRSARDCPVRLLDDKGQVLAQAKTDDQGTCQFELPSGKLTALTVEMEAGPGHKGSWTLEQSELLPATGAAGEAASPRAKEPEELSHGPSLTKIAGGIVLIFGLALAGRFIARKRKRA